MDYCIHGIKGECYDCANPVRRKAITGPGVNSWTKAETAAALAARAEGLTAAEVGQRIGRSKQAVTSQFAKLDGRNDGSSTRRSNARAQAESLKTATSYGEEYTDFDDEVLLAGEGTLREKAARLGRSLAGVNTRLAKLKELAVR